MNVEIEVQLKLIPRLYIDDPDMRVRVLSDIFSKLNHVHPKLNTVSSSNQTVTATMPSTDVISHRADIAVTRILGQRLTS